MHLTVPGTAANTSSDVACFHLCYPVDAGIETLQRKVAELITKLSIDKSLTSASLRKLTSATDPRPAARYVGMALGVGVMAAVFGGLLVLDSEVFMKQLHGLLRNIKVKDIHVIS
jgi:hypothetical protein